MILFHAAVLSFPVLAFMWTFYGFSLFTIIVGVEIKFLHTFGFALFHFVFLVIGLVYLIFAVANESSKPYSIIVLLALITLAIAYIVFITKMIKRYLPVLQAEIDRIFKMKRVGTSDERLVSEADGEDL